MKYQYIILLVTIFLVIVGIIIYLRRKRNPDSSILVRTSRSNIEGKGEEGFISFMCNCAKEEKIPMLEHEVKKYFTHNFESLQLSYVYQTCSPLLLNDLPKLLEKASKKYCRK